VGDLEPFSFVQCPAGHVDHGLIEDAHAALAGVQPGPIRLQIGYSGKKGFGYLHVQGMEDRMRQITGMGFKGFGPYCSEVAKNYTRICQGDDGRLMLVWPKDGYNLELVVEWKEGGFWTVVTGLPKRVERAKVLCEVARKSESEPTPYVAKRTRFATLSLPKKV
jgi:hypothetical protein